MQLFCAGADSHILSRLCKISQKKYVDWHQEFSRKSDIMRQLFNHAQKKYSDMIGRLIALFNSTLGTYLKL